MLLDVKQSCVLLVDVQEKLTPHVMQYEQMVANCHWLLRLCREMDVPVLVSEHYPKGLGATVTDLQDIYTQDEVIEKVHFSCASDQTCMGRINELNREQVILIGIETHVCILQTAIELQQSGKQVYVVANAVSSRFEVDHNNGLQRMRAAGIQIVTKEMVFFEWLHQAGTEQFKALSKAFMK